MTNLRNYIALNPRRCPRHSSWTARRFQSFGLGSGMLGLPGDFTPPSRFVRAAAFSATVLPVADGKAGVFNGFHMLNNFDIP